MNKLVTAVLGIAMLAVATPAFAATVSSNAIFNGQTQVYGNAGSSADISFQVDVPAGQVLHAIRTKVDGQATVCTAIGPFEGAQTVDVPVSITLPPNTNNSGYNLIADLYYTDTLPQAEAMTDNLACTSSVGGSHVNLGAYNGGTVVNVLPTSGGSTTTGTTSTSPWQAAINALTAQIAAIAKLVTPASGSTTPAPTTNTKCAVLAQKMVGAAYGTRNSANIVLQGYLLSESEQIPALAAGSSFGLWLNQTQDAVNHFKSVNSCQ